jgi:hypothetical protein
MLRLLVVCSVVVRKTISFGGAHMSEETSVSTAEDSAYDN